MISEKAAFNDYIGLATCQGIEPTKTKIKPKS